MADIEKYDPNKLVNGLRERIRGLIAELLPQEQLDALIKKAVTEYLEDQPITTDYYNRPTPRRPSGLKELVHSLCEETVRDRWIAFKNDPEWGSVWSNETLGKKLMEIATQHAGDFMTKFFSDMMRNFLRVT